VGCGGGRDPQTGEIRRYGDYEATVRALEACVRRDRELDLEWKVWHLWQHLVGTLACWPEQTTRMLAHAYLRTT
jgi:hypothetical protein